VPGAVLDAVRAGRITPIVTWELIEEIVGVVRRPRIARYGVTEADITDLVDLLVPIMPVVDIDVAIRDPRDAPVVAAALAGRADAIVTGDLDLVAGEVLRGWLRERGVEVVTPAELVARLTAPT
jgi:putative PIN family toxin of toxin-antitoxin system